jgi:uncharacterized membrane protein
VTGVGRPGGGAPDGSSPTAPQEEAAQEEAAQDANLETATHLERVVASVLRGGVSLSCVVLAAGAVRTLWAQATRRAAARAVPSLRRGTLHQPGWATYHSIASVLSGAVHGDGPALVMVGVLLLVATPVVRVAVSVVAYAMEGDRRFVVITAVVLAVLLGSFAVG